jgi:pimeloyl-ACP methyl ester carboxylesterase/DNA-binding CsgD family transcriptional regulator
VDAVAHVGRAKRAGLEGDARLLVETLYALAAQPESWEQLISALELPHSATDLPEEVAAELEGIHKVTALARRQGEGPPEGQAKDVGLVLLSPSAVVLACCALARGVLEPHLASVAVGTRLQLHHPDNHEALQRALVEAKRSGQHAILRLERPKAGAPVFCYVADSSALAGSALRNPAAFALMFSAPEPEAQVWGAIGKSFGLTAAELRLAAKLREGLALSEAAEELGVSVNTVRNQLRAIFDKMGLKRQSDLIRTLTELAAVGRSLVATSASSVTEDPPIRSVQLADGRRLAFRDYGPRSGRPLLIYHGGMSSSLMPPGTGALANALNLRVVCAERPGFGQSDRRADYRFETVAEDMEQLCDRLELHRPALCGVVSGAPFALATAQRMGDRATGVYLLAGRPPRPVEQNLSPLSELRARFESHPWVVETFYAILRMRLSPDLARRLLKRLASFSEADRAYFDAHPEMFDFVFAYVSECLAHGGRGIADEMTAFRRGQTMNLTGIRAPVVIWHGVDDQFSPMRDMVAFVGDHVAEVQALFDSGHLAPFKYWRKMMERIGEGAPHPIG